MTEYKPKFAKPGPRKKGTTKNKWGTAKQGKGVKGGWPNKIWKKFSIYIRVRDAASGSGLCRCISCDSFGHWTMGDAGHYQNRKYTNIIYNEKNVNWQCRVCNQFGEGQQVNYRIGMVIKYGEDDTYKLDVMRGYKNWKPHEFQALYDIIVADTKRIRAYKGL